MCEVSIRRRAGGRLDGWASWRPDAAHCCHVVGLRSEKSLLLDDDDRPTDRPTTGDHHDYQDDDRQARMRTKTRPAEQAPLLSKLLWGLEISRPTARGSAQPGPARPGPTKSAGGAHPPRRQAALIDFGARKGGAPICGLARLVGSRLRAPSAKWRPARVARRLGEILQRPPSAVRAH